VHHHQATLYKMSANNYKQNNQNQLKSQLSQSQFKVKITMLNINKVKKCE
jgi:hypothetical protein